MSAKKGKAEAGETARPAAASIAPLGRDREAGVPGGWNEVAELLEMRRNFAKLATEEKDERSAWGVDSDKAAFGAKKIDVPQRMKSA